jgi:2-deoxy-D-gluconate 3-dehydrogenase
MILDQFKLDGKVAIVTGSATGLGQGIAVGLAEAGADIAGVYNRRSPEETRARVEKLGESFWASRPICPPSSLLGRS